MTDQLLPCPFCGSTPKVIDFPESAIHIACRCGAQMFGGAAHFGDKHQAVATWNTRTQPADQLLVPRELLERLDFGKDTARALQVLPELRALLAQPAASEPKPVLRIAGGDVIPEAKILHGDWRALPHGTELFTHPAPAGVALPGRKRVDPYCYDQGGNCRVDGWNACLDEVARLNGVKE